MLTAAEICQREANRHSAVAAMTRLSRDRFTAAQSPTQRLIEAQQRSLKIASWSFAEVAAR